MEIRVKEDVDVVARAYTEVQAAFINAALNPSPEQAFNLKDVIDRQSIINWNLLEIVE